MGIGSDGPLRGEEFKLRVDPDFHGYEISGGVGEIYKLEKHVDGGAIAYVKVSGAGRGAQYYNVAIPKSDVDRAARSLAFGEEKVVVTVSLSFKES